MAIKQKVGNFEKEITKKGKTSTEMLFSRLELRIQ